MVISDPGKAVAIAWPSAPLPAPISTYKERVPGPTSPLDSRMEEKAAAEGWMKCPGQLHARTGPFSKNPREVSHTIEGPSNEFGESHERT